MFELLIEFLFELFGQIIVELGFHSLVEPFKSDRKARPVTAFFGYLILGAIAGGVSLLLLPSNFIRDPNMQILNLAVTPVSVGLFFAAFGRVREQKGMELFGLDRFSYGFVFALAVALIRFKFAA